MQTGCTKEVRQTEAEELTNSLDKWPFAHLKDFKYLRFDIFNQRFQNTRSFDHLIANPVN